MTDNTCTRSIRVGRFKATAHWSRDGLWEVGADQTAWAGFGQAKHGHEATIFWLIVWRFMLTFGWSRH